MNTNSSTPPSTRDEAEQTIRNTIAGLRSAWRTGMHPEDQLTDQYTRILSARLWHDVQRWRVEELAINTGKLDEALKECNTHDAHMLQDVVNALTNDMLTYRAWPKVAVSA
jgi:hypothetical protein